MRVTGGRFKGYVLLAPKGRALRPTADRVREALFNRLAHAGWGEGGGGLLVDARVVDAFAGTGALGIEALSRGAAHVTFLDNDPAAITVIGRNLRGLDIRGRVKAINADACNPPVAAEPCDLVLMDPPYGSDLAESALTALGERSWLASGTHAVVELAAKQPFTPPAGFEIIDARRYGAARLVYLKRE